MITIDRFLINLLDNSENPIENYFSKKDARVLRSLGNIISGPNFITENQGKLLLKILRENQSKIPNFSNDIETLFVSPSWSQGFRQIIAVKKMFIANHNDRDPTIIVEFTFSAPIRKTLQEISKKISNFTQTANGKLFSADLTEHNIVTLVDALAPYKFDVDPKLEDYYNTIKSWSENEVKNQFLLTTIVNQNFQKHITEDLGLTTAIDENIISDRSIRYQYFDEKTEKNPENLTKILATRTGPKIWVDKNKHSLEDVIKSLIELKRFPTLVVFDSHNVKNCFRELEDFSENLEKNRIFDNVGIYFRLDNDENGKEFNNLIKEKSYNCQLDDQTKIVGVQGGKIPKFLLKSDWSPMSVISLGNNLRNSKTAVYASRCDLIITYTDTEPMIENRILWE